MVDTLRILFMAYGIGNGGGISNILYLLSAYARTHPRDKLYIITSQDSWLKRLETFPNVELRLFRSDIRKELLRFALGFFGIRLIAKRCDANLIWCINFGSYLPLHVPQVLAIHNAYSIYPWEVHHHHPDNFLQLGFLRCFFRISLARSQGVVVQTELMAEYVRRLTIAPSKILVSSKALESYGESDAAPLPSYILSRLEDSCHFTIFKFLYVATFSPHKNHTILVDAMEELRRKNVRIRLVVTIDEETIRKIRPGVGDNLMSLGYIVPLGWVSKRHLHALYDACDACVMPSLLEAFSSAHLEAMGWGKPQVCADLPYAHDLCGAASLYAKADDPNDWGEKMRLIAEDATLREHLVEAGYNRMESFPESWTEVAERIRIFFSEVVREKGTRTTIKRL